MESCRTRGDAFTCLPASLPRRAYRGVLTILSRAFFSCVCTSHRPRLSPSVIRDGFPLASCPMMVQWLGAHAFAHHGVAPEHTQCSPSIWREVDKGGKRRETCVRAPGDGNEGGAKAPRSAIHSIALPFFLALDESAEKSAVYRTSWFCFETRTVPSFHRIKIPATIPRCFSTSLFSSFFLGFVCPLPLSCFYLTRCRMPLPWMLKVNVR